MVLDKKTANLLSEVSLDLSKAWLIGTFITPLLSGHPLNPFILTAGIVNAILFLIIARLFKEIEQK